MAALLFEPDRMTGEPGDGIPLGIAGTLQKLKQIIGTGEDTR